MRKYFKLMAWAFLGLTLVLAVGCDSGGPVEPVPSDTTPTSAEPPPGPEPVLPEEGP